MAVLGDLWYQAFASELLVLSAHDGSIISRVPLGETGRAGRAADMAVRGRDLLIVLRDDAVVQLSLGDAIHPRIVSRLDAAQLGVHPRSVSVADGEFYISGVGGVVRWRDGKRLIQSDAGEYSRVVASRGELYACVGRRIYRLDDQQYAGSASEMIPIPSGSGLPGSFIFIRRGGELTSVGLMSSDLREIGARRTTVRIIGPVHSARILDDRLWITTDEGVRGYVLRNSSLRLAFIIEIRGARDVDRIDDNHLAIAGVFGRSVYRLWDDSEGSGRTMTFMRREPAPLLWAQFDGRRVLAGSDEGAWLYDIGSDVRAVDEPAPSEASTQREAATIWSSARLDADGRSAVISTKHGEMRYREPRDALLHSIAAVDGALWLGHDNGITILSGREPDPLAVLGRLRLDGPVRFIFPLLKGGGAVYVCKHGGMGVAKIKQTILEKNK